MRVRALRKQTYLSERRFVGDEFNLVQTDHFNPASMAEVPGKPTAPKRRRTRANPDPLAMKAADDHHVSLT